MRSTVPAASHLIELHDSCEFAGQVLLINPTGLSVISDIDDTIKITNVSNRRAAIVNTFYNDYKPVPGMPELYRKWVVNQDAVFHYVSGSPWQLYLPLSEFLQSADFPAGTFHLRFFDWFGADAKKIFSPPEEMKRQTIQTLLDDFPHRKFILVGDTTEKDPEIYAFFAQKNPNQIHHIYIRNVTNESTDSDRFRTAFSTLPKSKWTLFTDPNNIK
jgi:phosphatidate phosphatase APP1